MTTDTNTTDAPEASQSKLLATSFPLGFVWELGPHRRAGVFVLNTAFGSKSGQNEVRLTLPLRYASQLTAGTEYKVEVSSGQLDNDPCIFEGNKKTMLDSGHAVEVNFTYLGGSFILHFPFRDHMALAPFLGSPVTLTFVPSGATLNDGPN